MVPVPVDGYSTGTLFNLLRNQMTIPYDMNVENRDLSISILQEHVGFLRELLESKNNWYEECLRLERERAEKSLQLIESYRQQITKLKIALAQAIQEVCCHNLQDDTTYVTNSDDIQEWCEALSD